MGGCQWVPFSFLWLYNFAGRAFTGRKVMWFASQRAQLVRESYSFYRKRQIETILTNIVAEHAKSRMRNARARPRKVRALTGRPRVPECASEIH